MQSAILCYTPNQAHLCYAKILNNIKVAATHHFEKYVNFYHSKTTSDHIAPIVLYSARQYKPGNTYNELNQMHSSI